jgi:hypothetical protein
MIPCAFHILLTAQIWCYLTSDYSGILKPPSVRPNWMNQSNFWVRSPNFWTQYRSRN